METSNNYLFFYLVSVFYFSFASLRENAFAFVFYQEPTCTAPPKMVDALRLPPTASRLP
jgi:hypothetical protein